uniref:Probable ATP-dependent transporter ycf16 n=1 Tax=Timspurckia oligopyrenoides TaxID=708627 RepID=A0A7S0ZJ57_9RHOD
MIGKRLIHLNFVQLQREADFRFGLVRVRENAESIAFYRGESQEKLAVSNCFQLVIENFYELLIWTRNLDMFTTFYNYLIQIMPIFLVAPIYFSGAIQLGALNQAWSAFNHVLSDLSWIIDSFDQLSSFSAGIDRLGEFVEEIESKLDDSERVFMSASDFDQVSKQQNQHDGLDTAEDSDLEDESFMNVSNSSSVIELKEGLSQETPLIIDSLNLYTPDTTRRMLIHNISIKIANGQRLMLVGPSGSGKSSLLRAIAGLWNVGSGTVSVTSYSKAMFLPQKPFCTVGSLRAQLIYPSTVSEVDVELVTDSKLNGILDQVGLTGLVDRFDGFESVRDWSDVLSTGEQQRLAFGRLMFSYSSGRIDFALLDEATAALDSNSEKKVYQLLQSTNMSYISVGHRFSLLEYHSKLLRLHGDTQWQLEEITDERRAQAAAVAQLQA